MQKPFLECNDLCFAYHNLKGETVALSHITFTVAPKEFIAIVGPSGCGKSTLLSLISGLIKPEHGTITIRSPRHQIGYMLQQDHLLEWRTILQNILLGPEINHMLTPEKQELANKLLADYGLWEFRNKHPSELSGGMKQRAALIRTMIMEPELVLLDEPFSALDYQTRLVVSADIGNIIRASGKTAIFVTHDLSEAISLSDRILVLSRRPATIKADVPIHLNTGHDNPLSARNAPEFKQYFTQLWKEIADEYDESEL